jgi:hypothetical protein
MSRKTFHTVSLGCAKNSVDVKGGGLDKHGVVFFEFSPKTKKIINARFFWN